MKSVHGSVGAERAVSGGVPAARSLERSSADLAKRLRTRHAELSEALLERIREVGEGPVAAGDALFAASQRKVAGAVVEAVIASIEREEPSPGAAIEAAIQATRRAAHLGIGLETTLRRYTAGYELLSHRVLEQAHRLDCPAESREALSHRASMLLASLLSTLICAVTGEHSRGPQRAAHPCPRRRAELIDRALCGDRVDAAELCYDLDLVHVGLIISGAEAQEALRRLAAELGLRLLSDQPDGQTIRAWLGAREPICSGQIEEVFLGLCCPEVSLAIGEPTGGLQGFGESHLQAQDAQRVLSLSSAPAVRFIDVAPVALILRDEPRARSLIGAYLGALEDRGERGIRDRKTLSAYLVADCNAHRAATALHLSARGVAYRIQKIEDRLGYPVCERRTELTVALRLEELLEPRELTGPF